MAIKIGDVITVALDRTVRVHESHGLLPSDVAMPPRPACSIRICNTRRSNYLGGTA